MTNPKLLSEKIDRAVVFVKLKSVLPEKAHFFVKCSPVLEFRDPSSSFFSNDAFHSLLDLLERDRMLDDLIVFLQLHPVWEGEKWFKAGEGVSTEIN